VASVKFGNDSRKARCDRAQAVAAVKPLHMGVSKASRLARLWLDQHGDNAITLARDMAAELEASGIFSGATLWRRVITNIEGLQKTRAKRRVSGYRRIVT
jgi:hypothetical protein